MVDQKFSTNKPKPKSRTNPHQMDENYRGLLTTSAEEN